MDFDIPDIILQRAAKIMDNLLPQRSVDRYNSTYAAFRRWQANHHVHSFDENVLLVYFDTLSQKFAPITLWANYSMLKSTIQTRHNVDIGKYAKLTVFLKRKSDGFKSMASVQSNWMALRKIEKINLCIFNYFNFQFQVLAVFGICGACRSDEITNVQLEDVKDYGDHFIVYLPVTKTKISRTFTISGNFYAITKKYANLRPTKASTTRFFVNYQNQKCTVQNVGKNKVAGTPKIIAKFNNLPDASSYTGHAFRRTSATLLADAGGNITDLKRHGGWKSTTVAEGYIADSIGNKRRIEGRITSSIF